MQIRPVEDDLLHEDRQTDIAKLIDSFCNLKNRLKLVKMSQGTQHAYYFPVCRNSMNCLA